MRLKNWRSVISTLADPRTRPNNFDRLVLDALRNGMTVRDAARVFGLGENTIHRLSTRLRGVSSPDDLPYFVVRAHKLGASDELIVKWFGLQRVDQVATIIAKANDSEAKE